MDNKNPNRQKTISIQPIRYAMTAVVFMFYGIALLIDGPALTTAAAQPTSSDKSMLLAFSFFAAITYSAGMLLVSRVRSNFEQFGQLIIPAMAMFETLTLYALVLFFIGEIESIYVLYAAIFSALHILFVVPRKRETI